MLKLAYDHPEAIEAVATLTGHPKVAEGIATAVGLAHGNVPTPQAPTVAPVPASLPAEPAAPAVEPPPVAPTPPAVERDEKALRRAVKSIYKNSKLDRYPTDEQEYEEAIVLIEAGREDELLRNLNARA